MRKFILATLIGTMVGIVGIELTAESQPTFKAAVDVVPISAIVRDGRGRLVTTLNAGDFEILDKGERRSILDFQTDDTTPITLAVLVDVSGSMRMGPKMAFRARGLAAGPGRPAPRRRRGRLSSRSTQRCTNSGRSRRDPIRSAAPSRRRCHSAPRRSTTRSPTRPGGSNSTATQRRAVLVITDGEDTSSSLEPPRKSQGSQARSTCPSTSWQPCPRSITR